MRRGGGGGDYSGLEGRCRHGSNLFRLDMAAERAPAALAHADTLPRCYAAQTLRPVQQLFRSNGTEMQSCGSPSAACSLRDEARRPGGPSQLGRHSSVTETLACRRLQVQTSGGTQLRGAESPPVRDAPQQK